MVIRPITPTDAAGFLELRKKLDRETSLLMYEPGERIASSGEELAVITNIVKNGGTIFVVDDKGTLAGFLEAVRGTFRRNQHTVTVVVGILQAYTGQGLGKRLFQKLESWARDHTIHRLELTVQSHNQQAIVLYQKMGFTIEGTKHDSLLIDGRYVNEYYMAKLLN